MHASPHVIDEDEDPERGSRVRTRNRASLSTMIVMVCDDVVKKQRYEFLCTSAKCSDKRLVSSALREFWCCLTKLLGTSFSV